MGAPLLLCAVAALTAPEVPQHSASSEQFKSDLRLIQERLTGLHERFPAEVSTLKTNLIRSFKTLEEKHSMAVKYYQLKAIAEKAYAGARRRLLLIPDEPQSDMIPSPDPSEPTLDIATEFENLRGQICVNQALNPELTSAIEQPIAEFTSTWPGLSYPTIMSAITQLGRCACTNQWDLSNPAYNTLARTIQRVIEGDDAVTDPVTEIADGLKAVVPLFLGTGALCNGECQTAFQLLISTGLSLFEAMVNDVETAGAETLPAFAFPAQAKLGFPITYVGCMCGGTIDFNYIIDLIASDVPALFSSLSGSDVDLFSMVGALLGSDGDRRLAEYDPLAEPPTPTALTLATAPPTAVDAPRKLQASSVISTDESSVESSESSGQPLVYAISDLSSDVIGFIFSQGFFCGGNCKQTMKFALELLSVPIMTMGFNSVPADIIPNDRFPGQNQLSSAVHQTVDCVCSLDYKGFIRAGVTFFNATQHWGDDPSQHIYTDALNLITALTASTSATDPTVGGVCVGGHCEAMFTSWMQAFTGAIDFVANIEPTDGSMRIVPVGTVTVSRLNGLFQDFPRCGCHVFTAGLPSLVDFIREDVVPLFFNDIQLDSSPETTIASYVRMALRAMRTCGSENCRGLFTTIHDMVATLALPDGETTQCSATAAQTCFGGNCPLMPTADSDCSVCYEPFAVASVDWFTDVVIPSPAPEVGLEPMDGRRRAQAMYPPPVYTPPPAPPSPGVYTWPAVPSPPPPWAWSPSIPSALSVSSPSPPPRTDPTAIISNPDPTTVNAVASDAVSMLPTDGLFEVGDSALQVLGGSELWRYLFWATCAMQHVCPPPGTQGFVVQFPVVLPITIDEFDPVAFKRGMVRTLLAGQGLTEDDIVLKCNGGPCRGPSRRLSPVERRLTSSLAVTAEVTVSQSDTLDAVTSTLQTVDAATINNDLLGGTVDASAITVEPPQTITMAFPPHPPPPPMPPPPNPPLFPGMNQFTPFPPMPPPEILRQSAPSSGGLDGGTIAGIVVGALFGGAAIGAGVVYFVKQQQANPKMMLNEASVGRMTGRNSIGALRSQHVHSGPGPQGPGRGTEFAGGPIDSLAMVQKDSAVSMAGSI